MSGSGRLLPIALGLAVVAFLYRHNCLGGALGGFDNDHFIFFVRARQMLLGEQPLRDFADAGLQGAWPSLTYMFSAAAQRWLGGTLWAEALLACTGIALAIAVTFLVAARAAAVWAALVTSIAMLLLSTKLYNYTRLLVFAVGAALLARAARDRTWRPVAALTGWTVVAFLFRHDFGVYMGLASITAIALSHWGAWRSLAARLGMYAAVLTVLLMPPLVWVQRYDGLGRYITASRDMARREAERTTLRWPIFTRDVASPLRFFAEPRNATAWLYYTFWAIPLIGLVVFGFAWRLAHPPIATFGITLSVLVLVLDASFLRSNVAARFGDVGPPIAILSAMLLVRTFGKTRKHRLWCVPLVVLLVWASAASVFTLGSVVHELDTSGLSDSFEKTISQMARVRRELRELPGGGPHTDPIPAASAYLRRCTGPEDRILALLSTAEILGMSGRAFAGGQVTFIPGFYDTADDQRQTVARLGRQRVPIVIAAPDEAFEDDFVKPFARVDAYLRARYAKAGFISDGDRSVRVLVDRSLRPATMDAKTGLPCFR